MKEADEKRDLEEFRLLELAAAASRSLKNSPSRHDLSASGANARTNAHANGRDFQATGRSPPHPRGGADPFGSEVSGFQPRNGYGLSDAVGRYAAQTSDLFTGLDQSPSETRDASESPEAEALWSQSPNPTKNLSHFDDRDSWGDDGSEENDTNDLLGEDASGTTGEEGGPANVAIYGGECARARVRAVLLAAVAPPWPPASFYRTDFRLSWWCNSCCCSAHSELFAARAGSGPRGRQLGWNADVVPTAPFAAGVEVF